MMVLKPTQPRPSRSRTSWTQDEVTVILRRFVAETVPGNPSRNAYREWRKGETAAGRRTPAADTACLVMGTSLWMMALSACGFTVALGKES